ncbi:hypothetical protein H6804_00145 [Candidatus Nomurabacteria bacterium]|nr:hypothetical protein [Candidatus Nomurabacteria bacterium]
MSTKLIKMKKKTISISVLLLIGLVVCHAQTVTLKTQCGKIVESEFTVLSEEQEFVIPMEAGDVLEINIVPFGSYLKVCAKIEDPGGGLVVDTGSGMFGTEKKSLLVSTDVLSARGNYTLKVYNSCANQWGNVGTYSVYVKCKKRDGTIIEPK